MSKQEADRLADALDSITFVSGKSQTLDEAADLLRQWPDGEPVAVVEADGVLRFKKTGRKWQVGDKLYTAPPDSAARIAELEAALKVAGEALRHGIKTINHLGGAVECMPLHDAIQQIKEVQR